MAGREVREYTNLTDPKDRKWGKGKDKIDDEDITFQRMVAKMQEVAGERGGYLHGRGALDSDDLLYLKEQMEAEEDAERLLRRTEKRAFAAFKKAASLADSTQKPLPLPLRVEPKPKSGIRQQDLLKNIVEIKPKKPRVTSPCDLSRGDRASPSSLDRAPLAVETEHVSPQRTVPTCATSSSTGAITLINQKQEPVKSSSASTANSAGEILDVKSVGSSKSLLGLAYESSDEE